MEKDDLKNRKVDKLPLDKSKKYMWKYIQSKTGSKKAPSGSGFGNFWKSFVTAPAKLASVSAVAVVLIVAIVFGDSLRGLIPGVSEVQTVHASFEMTADSEDASGVERESTFTLQSSEDYSEGVIEDNLKVSPVVEVTIDKTGEGQYKVQPADLEPDTVYNFWIDSEDQRYSWAYQIKDNFKVTGTLPADQTTYVPVDSGIEFYLSHEGYDVDEFAEHFQIEPAVRGSFEKHNRTAVFVPQGGLKTGTLYTVTLEKGLKLAGSAQELDQDFTLQFETDSDTYTYENFSFVKDYYEVGTQSTVALRAYSYNADDFTPDSIDVEIYRYPDLDSYLSALESRFRVPEWCYFTKRSFKFDTRGLTNIGSFEALFDEIGWTKYVYFPNTNLEPGYYLVTTEYGGGDQAMLQITDVSSYINVSLTDTLLWVNDLKTGEPVSGAKVELSGLEEAYSTGKDGVLTFKTPEEWKKPFKDRTFSYIKTTSPDGKALITQVIPYNDEYLASGYWYTFFSDRPMYQPTDTIKFFGFIEPKSSKVNTEKLTMKLTFGWQTYLKEIPVKLDQDGTFVGETDIRNYSPGYYSLTLFNGDKEIAAQSVQVADYVKPTYDFTVESDKQAVFAGEEMNFEISSGFFDGTPVPYLPFEYYGGSGPRTEAKTDKNGKHTLNFKAEKARCSSPEYYCYDQHSFYFSANTTEAEETDIWSSATVQIFDSALDISGIGRVEEGQARIDVKTHFIDLSRINDGSNNFYNDFLGNVAGDRVVNGSITEIHWEKIPDGEYYDFINKKAVKKYRYERRESHYDDFKVKTDKNGEASYLFEMEPDKYYRISLEGPDDDGNTAHETVYVYGSARTGDYDYYNIKFLNGKENVSDFWGSSFTFGTGETVKAAFANNDSELAKDTAGKFLFAQHSNGFQEYSVENSPFYSFEFSKNDVPNVFVSGVWFTGERYETAYASSAQYDKELERLNIEIDTDKEVYGPGDEVTVSVKVTDQSGKPAKTKVNLNAVDEAFYKIVYDNFVDPLNDLYASNNMGVLATYDSHENPLAGVDSEGGLGGCFTGETKILMADGSHKAIKDIKEGDIVLTKDHEFSGRLVPAKVNSTVSHFVSEYLVINEDLEVTQEHVVFVNGAWDLAGNVREGDRMLGKDGELIEISSVRRVVQPVWVYNFEVDEKHTYFANDYYVHNDKGDDGIRSDFEDTALFEVITTDGNGKGELTFTLPDNITSWRVIAKAIDTKNLRAGAQIENINVSLPFFADLIMNKEYSVKDEPTVKFRSFGDALSEDDEVEYVLSAESLGMVAGDKISGKAFSGSYHDLPELKSGEHDITLFAESGKLEDAVREPIIVKGSRLTKQVSKLIPNVDAKTVFEPSGDRPTEIWFVDGGVGYYYGNLLSLYYDKGDRFDQRLSAAIAAELLKNHFAEERQSDFNDLVRNYQNQGGISLLPYSDPDLRLSALAVYADSDIARYNRQELSDYFYAIYKNTESNLEEVVLSLLGLAGMNEPVLISLREIRNADELDLSERLYIALAFEALGSREEALEIYNEILKQLAEENPYETALGAMLAAGLGEDNAAALLWEFVELKGIEDEIQNLYEIGYAKNSLEYLEAKPVTFKVRINEDSQTVGLEKWESFSLMAFPGDKVSVAVIDGQLAANLYYVDTVEPDEFKTDNQVTISRRYSVNGVETEKFKEGDLVQVTLYVNFEGNLKNPSFKITDILPSGLKLVTSPRGSDYHYYYRSNHVYPYRSNGQEVYFNWYKDSYSDKSISYYARVVNPGSFYADPAKIESFHDPDIANISDSNTVTILR